MKESKCWLRRYRIAMVFMILLQVYSLGQLTFGLQLVQSFHSTLWKNLDTAAIYDIQNTYDCCSFDSGTMMVDIYKYSCQWDLYPPCWLKFGGKITHIWFISRSTIMVILVIEILLYFSTQYVIGSIAEAEGVEYAGKNVETIADLTPLLTV